MSSRQTKAVTQADFSGGLNLNANAFVLGSSEFPSVSNMDIDLRGGLRRRGGVGIFRSEVPIPAPPHRIFRHRNHLIVQTSNRRLYVVGSGPSATHRILYTFPNTGNIEIASWGFKSYAVNGVDRSQVMGAATYNSNALNAPGSGLWPTGLPGRTDDGWSPELEEPQAGTFPIARLIAPWFGATRGNFFVADVMEYISGTWQRFPNRIRWSHPSRLDVNSALPPGDYRGIESWRKDADFMDLEPDVNDEGIKAMRQFGDYMMVFKSNSIWALYADDPNNGIPYAKLLARNVGTIANKTTIATERGVFFFSWPEGLFLWDGEQMRWLFEPLMPLITSGRLSEASSTQITLGYHNRRLYLSVPLDGARWNTHTFVYDPDIGEGRGAWTEWGIGFHNFYDWQHGARSALLGTVPLNPMASGLNAHPHVIEVSADRATDLYSVELGEQPVPAHIQTSWVGDRSGQLAQWRRPEFVVRASDELTLDVAVYQDFEANPTRNHTLALAGGDMESPRGDLLGKARAISLRVSETQGLDRWELQSITHKLWPRGHRL